MSNVERLILDVSSILNPFFTDIPCIVSRDVLVKVARHIEFKNLYLDLPKNLIIDMNNSTDMIVDMNPTFMIATNNPIINTLFPERIFKFKYDPVKSYNIDIDVNKLYKNKDIQVNLPDGYCILNGALVEVSNGWAYLLEDFDEAMNSDQVFALNAIADEENPLVCLTGPAGTGKTFLAMLGSKYARYQDFLVSRPTVPLGKDIGYLPGGMSEKLDPWFASIEDNKKASSVRFEVLPMAYVRGRSINGAYIIIDEAQNLTPLEAKTLLTRAGLGTKIVMCGDTDQSDLMGPNGLQYVIHKMKPPHVHMTKTVRSKLAEWACRCL